MTEWDRQDLGAASPLLHDPEITDLLSLDAELAAMLAVECALARAQASVGVIDSTALAAIETACQATVLDRAKLAAGVTRDGVIVPEMVRQMRAAIAEPHAKSFHLGTTSQDITDSSLMLRIRKIMSVLLTRLDALLISLDALSAKHGDIGLMARTRTQDALPFTMADKISTWHGPLADLRDTAPRTFPIQLAGPIGLAVEAFGEQHSTITKHAAQELELSVPSRSWHTDRRPLMDKAHWATMLLSALGKIGHDIIIMNQNSVAEVRVLGGSSSAMAHKNNPVQAEVLVSLARFGAGQRAILDQATAHENERSGISWTLEWLTLPTITVSCGAALLAANHLLANMKPGHRVEDRSGAAS